MHGDKVLNSVGIDYFPVGKAYRSTPVHLKKVIF